MTEWVDFKELREQLDFADVLRLYGVELKLAADQHHGFCPLPSHNGKKNSPSFSANIKRKIWQCFGCGRKGNVLDFAVLMERSDPKNGEDVRRVALALQEKLAGCPAREPLLESERVEGENVVVNHPLDFELKGLDRREGGLYLARRNFDLATAEWFGLGFCSRGLLKDRLAIPLHNPAGRLVGYAGRLVDDSTVSEENPKYRFPGRRRRKGVIHEFRKSLLLYNTHRLGVTGAVVRDVVVLEGFTGVWWLKQAARILNAVALMGASCSETQAQILVERTPPDARVWIMTDGDTAGERCAHEVFAQVAPHRYVRWARLESGKQPTDYSPEEIGMFLPFADGGWH